MAIYPAKGQI
jgi:hypothetical protein